MTLFTFSPDYLEHLAQGDPLVAQHFSAYFAEMLRMKLRTRLRSPHLIEDVLQETLLRVLRIVQKGGVQHPERFGAFVSAVCTNVLREAVRGEGRYDAMDESAPEPADHSIDLEGDIASSQRRKKVEDTLKTLEPRDREILRLVFLDEVDRSAVCRQFSINEEYLRVLLHRAKAKFRQNFEPADPTEGSRSASSGNQ